MSFWDLELLSRRAELYKGFHYILLMLVCICAPQVGRRRQMLGLARVAACLSKVGRPCGVRVPRLRPQRLRGKKGVVRCLLVSLHYVLKYLLKICQREFIWRKYTWRRYLWSRRRPDSWWMVLKTAPINIQIYQQSISAKNKFT